MRLNRLPWSSVSASLSCIVSIVAFWAGSSRRSWARGFYSSCNSSFHFTWNPDGLSDALCSHVSWWCYSQIPRFQWWWPQWPRVLQMNSLFPGCSSPPYTRFSSSWSGSLRGALCYQVSCQNSRPNSINMWVAFQVAPAFVIPVVPLLRAAWVSCSRVSRACCPRVTRARFSYGFRAHISLRFQRASTAVPEITVMVPCVPRGSCLHCSCCQARRSCAHFQRFPSVPVLRSLCTHVQWSRGALFWSALFLTFLSLSMLLRFLRALFFNFFSKFKNTDFERAVWVFWDRSFWVYCSHTSFTEKKFMNVILKISVMHFTK